MRRYPNDSTVSLLFARARQKMFSARDPVDFLQRVEAAADRPGSGAVLDVSTPAVAEPPVGAQALVEAAGSDES